jgi:hypothetical protein
MGVTEDETMHYETEGNVRGNCGHRHRTLDGAIRCLRRDHRGCVSQGGYSDRYIYRVDGAERVAMIEVAEDHWLPQPEAFDDE